MQNGTATLENNVAVSYLHKCISKIPVNNYPSPREIKNFCSHKKCSCHKKLGTKQMFSTGGWINKLWYTDAMQNYLETRRNKLLIHINLEESQLWGWWNCSIPWQWCIYEYVSKFIELFTLIVYIKVFKLYFNKTWPKF